MKKQKDCECKGFFRKLFLFVAIVLMISSFFYFGYVFTKAMSTNYHYVDCNNKFIDNSNLLFSFFVNNNFSSDKKVSMYSVVLLEYNDCLKKVNMLSE